MKVSKLERRLISNTFTVLLVINVITYLGLLAFLIGYSLIR
jgi:hypothetical protein